MRTSITILAIIFFNLKSSVGQWTKINTVPDQDIVALTTMGDTVFAASDTNILYKSIDGGMGWSPIMISNNPVHIITLKVIDNKIYVGTFDHGIFRSTDYGFTWSNTGIGLPAITGIEKKGNDIYAATLGNGVYVFNPNTNDWVPFNNSLPSYSVNVYTISGAPNSLLIGSGANGTFYRYNFNTHDWNEEYYYGSLHPGLLIQKLINNSDTLFAVNQDRIIKSEDNGLSWTDDKTGSHDGLSRTIYSGTNYYYSITNTLTLGTWIQERSKSAVIGSTWAANEEFLPNSYAYDILEFHDKLFLARADGLYVKELLSGVNSLVREKSNVKIYPDPSDGSVINISCDHQINKLTITSTMGQIVYSDNIRKNEFTIQANLPGGVYLVSFVFPDRENVVKKIIIE